MSDRERCVKILSADNVTILDLEGEIDIYTATDFKEALLESIAGGARQVIVDATKVTFMDSSALSVLISGEQRLHSLGGSLAVACEDNRATPEDHGPAQAFASYASRDEALRAAFSRRSSSDAVPTTDSPGQVNPAPPPASLRDRGDAE